MRKFAALLLLCIVLTSCSPLEAKNDAQIKDMTTPTPSQIPVQEEIMYKLNETITINQVGYFSTGKKTFWTLGMAQTFHVIDTKTGEAVFSGEMVSRGQDTAIGSEASYGDFTEVTKEGKYFIAVGDDKSYDFEIKNDAYNDLSQSLLKMLYLQRCGIELEEQYAGDYAHEACHTMEGKVWGDTESSVNIQGGWHDAGDFGRYSVPCARTIADLLFSYELYPDVFSDDTNIPESGNGIPDVLDEARVGLEWLLQMQREDGGVYHKYTSEGFCGMIMPEQDFLTHYAIVISPTATASFSAIMAKASGVYANIDEEFADAMKTASLKAYEFMKENPDLPLYENPDGILTGDYKDLSVQDELYWAALELYLLTDDENYLSEAKGLYTKHTALFWSDTLEWYDVGFLGTFSYLLSDKADKNSEFYTQIKKDTLETADNLCTLAKKHAFNVAMDDKDYIWGSNMVLTNRANVLLVAYEIEGKKEYLETAQAHLDYLLGTNALSQCYVTGFGSKSIMFPHDRPSVADRVKEPKPGMVSGGPNSALQDPVAEANFTVDTPPALCFSDETASYSMNEITTYWNSSALFMTAGLIANK